MTDPSRFQSSWNFNHLTSPRDNISLDDNFKMLSSPRQHGHSNGSSPLYSSLSGLPSPSQQQQRLNVSPIFPSFDPFNTDALENSTNNTNIHNTKDNDLDELSNLLSRQFLEDVDAETIPTNRNNFSSSTRTTLGGNHTHSAELTTTRLTTPWRLNMGDTFGRPWSPVGSDTTTLGTPSLSHSSLLLSGSSNQHNTNMFTSTIDQQRQEDTNKNEYISTPTRSWWDRFEPYDNDSEFDPTIQFSQDNLNGHHATTDLVTTTTTTTTGNKDETENISVEQQQEPSMAMMALKKLSQLFKDHDEKELGKTLAAFDYDVERTIEALLSSSSSTEVTTTTTSSSSSSTTTPLLVTPTTVSTDNNQKVQVVTSSSPKVGKVSKTVMIASSPSSSVTTITTSSASTAISGSPKKRQVCRHYLAGECYRKDCWFAHDLEVKPCKFWLQGLCLKGDTCEFAHNLEEVENVARYHSPNTYQQEQDDKQQDYHQYTPTVADFPLLIARPSRKSKKFHNKKSFKK
ncbi:uncharacterized protein BX664DRAFT_386503 [Halteromyces radiatus]|uniref:uncharacterized protein n=1 Tax=Halteromyces radiatus TaxID=101107 RepID=UPI0022204260|nr:uncharacterized protein BX664DRAFT_386503 [Halteromyces radiatus]KAI8086036.1 hypothetical protein BX664DRAFT_386503 [Halteromyces radiatus]